MVERELKVDEAGQLNNCLITMGGCRECVKEAFVYLLLHKPAFKEFFNSVIRLANERRAQKEN